MTIARRAAFQAALAFASLSCWPVLSAAQYSSASSADSEPGVREGSSFGPRLMYFKPKDADGDWHGGAQLRLHLSPVWALEGSADYRRERFGPTRETRVDVFPVQASLLAYLVPEGPVCPFLLGGAGWYFTHVKAPGGFDETRNRFGWHAGGGLELFLNRSWSLDGSYRYVWVEDVRSKDAGLLDKDYREKGHMITAALNYHF